MYEKKDAIVGFPIRKKNNLSHKFGNKLVDKSESCILDTIVLLDTWMVWLYKLEWKSAQTALL